MKVTLSLGRAELRALQKIAKLKKQSIALSASEILKEQLHLSEPRKLHLSKPRKKPTKRSRDWLITCLSVLLGGVTACLILLILSL